jgi:hypothetical protein
MSHIYYTYLVLSYEHFLAAQLVILDQYSQYYLFAAPQPCASEQIPGHLKQLLTLPVECILPAIPQWFTPVNLCRQPRVAPNPYPNAAGPLP